MFPYIPNGPKEEKMMLESIKVNSVDELFEDIPAEVRLGRKLNLGHGMSELELYRHMRSLAGKNKGTEELICFLGAGAYDHYIPSVIKHITSRSEFYTAYTPYQPEISQGTLQVIFEYQTMIANLTGMDVSNASMYDGSTACAEAAIMACENTKRKSIVVSKTVHPETRKVLKTYMRFLGIEVLEVDYEDGSTDVEKLRSLVSANTAGVIVQYPNFFGIIEDLTEVEEVAHGNKAMMIVSIADPISLGALKSPGELGADIVVGEGQALGNPLNYGGPYLGFMATTAKLMRKLPGRIVGQTNDLEGKRAFVLTLQAREQHIRREKATSNICSNQALNALTAAVYLTTMGKQGIKEVAMQSAYKAHYAYNQLLKSGCCSAVFNKPFFKEFAVGCTESIDKVNGKLLNAGILGGYDLSLEYPELTNSTLLCVTEKRTKEEIDKLVSVMVDMREGE
ncbi:aminomethyl-transferring glycine dehydrogenase subunit GcvPA [Lutispora thermophila]|uniref:Probable glycine dehydrogenase (decarboxylating) subunit 1 n=1 Tax=Lutispora thermophila DSM 19022 TaxID=1122184 RepID=A0A1M6GXG2_9FIRM|nr:aminomethyl-transferring glycine dehydrogenase subunit GcvPA [Lutispora thermophila]SHJ14678.1 glycine dehydrogenase (decarboxylating) alpha subunit [Lutispora thermophila DSM 19022]